MASLVTWLAWALQVRYLRVSALDQKEVRQIDGVELDKRFTYSIVGKDRNRSSLIPTRGVFW